MSRVKVVGANMTKKVIGSGFGQSGAFAERTSGNTAAQRLNSGNGPKNPTTTIKITPGVAAMAGDVFTVVLPNGRRSNPFGLN